jgi:hypothetical protein
MPTTPYTTAAAHDDFAAQCAAFEARREAERHAREVNFCSRFVHTPADRGFIVRTPYGTPCIHNPKTAREAGWVR